MGRAAIVTSGKPIFELSCADEKTAKIAKDVLNRIKPKVACKNKIVYAKVE